ncbi:hypothetical protein [Anabaena azotica]|uniref:Uncharacterized protein n=1 Tax=Anabaena azotica FACHB-119 TaxID=947527 RepID=A0ABR8DAG2_9NOST|nr:hypothetical protein [Anabaena azotica]MBD2503428.1 hypothetical protein [Anabaena azotica FACHB-119]
MVFSDAQSQASPERRGQTNSQHEPFGHQSTETRSISVYLGNQPFRGSRDDSERGDVPCRTGGHTAGGTIKQLISETLEELQESESRSDKLRKRLVQLSNLLESVESPDKTQQK